MEAQRICPWVNTASLQTGLTVLQETLSCRKLTVTLLFSRQKRSLLKMLLVCRRWPFTSSLCLLQHTAANQLFQLWALWQSHTAALSLIINTYIRTWLHKDCATSPINAEMYIVMEFFLLKYHHLLHHYWTWDAPEIWPFKTCIWVPLVCRVSIVFHNSQCVKLWKWNVFCVYFCSDL